MAHLISNILDMLVSETNELKESGFNDFAPNIDFKVSETNELKVLRKYTLGDPEKRIRNK